mmetsp:Transcript_54537/g.151035  ORF Transcript_54537/g.151035 Transcript_54537/m.151035 type:complete len:200 (-) Transcript_54537:119-718(-)
MHAILGVDDQLFMFASSFCCCRGFVIDVFIDTRRTKPLFRATIDLERRILGNIGAFGFDSQMRGLIIRVIGSTTLKVGQQIKGQFAIGSGILFGSELFSGFGGLGIRVGVSKRPGFSPFGDMCSQSIVYQSTTDSPFRKGLMAIADLEQFVINPGRLQFGSVRRHFLGYMGFRQFTRFCHGHFVACCESFKDRFGGQHA